LLNEAASITHFHPLGTLPGRRGSLEYPGMKKKEKNI